jgi:hypothetical protein
MSKKDPSTHSGLAQVYYRICDRYVAHRLKRKEFNENDYSRFEA